ncbi:WD40 repeat-like protein [Conidiobolus coronatus NRRL 28638]|uniref:WD40 repeat-like protein n=1 Tax=Conidiobolus coronatus (strain ATCC 28846 / CBS 209.66 / NRRL 28638) TaxID=796925 RepID=A0A137PJF8_CONC2|nr:WD40 repeat-like protein [Conidiobolus coronatus NRRL 28638]|eukprot:KXN75110.1 WD40 repeat-like protein [Conidiobolus coronatus NRRL 28638]
MSPEELTEAQIQDLLQASITNNDSIQSMKYFNMLKEVKSGSDTPQRTSKQHGNQSTSSNRKQTNSQTNDLKDELDKIAAKQTELDSLKAKVAKLTEELERDRKKFLDMFQSKVPGGKSVTQEQTNDHPSARSSSVSSSSSGSSSASNSEKSRESSPEPKHSAQKLKTPERPQTHKSQNNVSNLRVPSVQTTPIARPPPQQPTPTNNTAINSNFINFTGFFNPETLNVHILDRVQGIKASGYDDKLRFDPPYYKTIKQGRKCRSLILGNIKSPYGNRLNDIAITSCMNGIVTIYSGKDYDISTNLDLKDVNYRWAEDICFIQPDLVAVLAYSDAARLAPTPVSLLTLKSQTSKGPVQPALLPINIQPFTKPLSCITPINLDDEYIEFVTGGVDHKVSIWKLPKTRKFKQMATNVSIASARIGHSSVVNSVAFDPQSKYLHSGGADCKYFITDPTRMSEIYSAKYASRINQIVVHPTMPHLQAISFATENRQFQLVDSRQNARKTIAHFGFQMDKLLTKYAKHSICNRGNLVACNDPTSNDILIWDLRYTKVDQEFQRFKSHDKKVNCVQFSPFKDSLIFSDEHTQLGITDFSFN